MEYATTKAGRRVAPYGHNIAFLADYIFNNPGCTSRHAREALCAKNRVQWTNATDMRGQYSTYFCTGWIGSSWRKNPCGRYWTRLPRPDGKIGYLLTLEGLGKVGQPIAA